MSLKKLSISTEIALPKKLHIAPEGWVDTYTRAEIDALLSLKASLANEEPQYFVGQNIFGQAIYFSNLQGSYASIVKNSLGKFVLYNETGIKLDPGNYPVEIGNVFIGANSLYSENASLGNLLAPWSTIYLSANSPIQIVDNHEIIKEVYLSEVVGQTYVDNAIASASSADRAYTDDAIAAVMIFATDADINALF